MTAEDKLQKLEKRNRHREENLRKRLELRQEKRQAKHQKRDPRVNVRNMGLIDHAIIFLALCAVNGGYLMIYQSVFNIAPTLENMLRPELFGFTLLATVVCGAVMAAIRNRIYNRPMRRLGAAARQVAAGDFTVRVAPIRTDGKKDQMEVLIDDFNRMAEELASIETLKNDFIGNVSHELKTPLAIIQNYASLLKSSGLTDAEREEYAGTIAAASQRLSALVSNILKLNKLENQEITPAAAPYDLSEQLRGCALAFEDLWEGKNIDFEAELPDTSIVCYDADMLEIVWNNLLSNAIKFTSPGGTVRLCQREEAGCVVTVADTGCGMEPAVLEHIFDKFYQGDASHAQEGNGLGLALAKRVVDLAGGSIAVESAPGEGTTFTVRLPIPE